MATAGHGTLRKGSKLEYFLATTHTDKHGNEKTIESWQTIILKDDPKKLKDTMWMSCCYETGPSSRLFKVGSASFNFARHDPDGGWRFIDEAENKIYNKWLATQAAVDASVKPKQSKAGAKIEPDSMTLNRSLPKPKTTPPANAASVAISSSSTSKQAHRTKREREPSREPSQEPSDKQLKKKAYAAIMMYGDKTDPEEIGRDIVLQLEEMKKYRP